MAVRMGTLSFFSCGEMLCETLHLQLVFFSGCCCGGVGASEEALLPTNTSTAGYSTVNLVLTVDKSPKGIVSLVCSELQSFTNTTRIKTLVHIESTYTDTVGRRINHVKHVWFLKSKYKS